MKLTEARRRALEAVRDGRCYRRYTNSGNTLVGPVGVSSTTLWHLARAGLVDNDPKDRSPSIVRLAMTKAGTAIIANNEISEQIRTDTGG